MHTLTASIGGKHNAKVKKTWRGTWDRFCELMLARVPETMDKASAGWICACEFDKPWRDSDNFISRQMLSFDYDHIEAEDLPAILECYKRYAYLAFTTWSHTESKPRLRLWLPLSRPVGFDEFQAISRRVAAEYGIDKMARESHVPCQFYFRPAIKPFEGFQSWINASAWIDADAKLAEYSDWSDRSLWPHRSESDRVHGSDCVTSPLSKHGVIGAFNRAFDVPTAIEKFELPYVLVR